MKREVRWFLFGTIGFFLLLLPEKGIPVISDDLKDICINDYYLEPLGSKNRPSPSKGSESRGSYLVLELSASSRSDGILVFANHFLLMSATRDGLMHSSGPKAILRCGDVMQMPSFSVSPEYQDHITMGKGKTDFCLFFYLAPKVTPTQLHYLGAWPLTYPVPYKLKKEVKHAQFP